ncbi:hypothetical protein [Desulfosarcina cetonica]|uniref:hypothetical protein n=1 Tax=Desulfosarcina cetonica TaxID=90730 RepID=UPI0006D14F46|nr:hypothetical protein [Desulfosarcina cetonica]
MVGKRELPWAFSRVGRGDVSYSLRFRSQLWGEDGYFPDTTPVIPPSSDVRVSQASLSRGYYIGDHWLKGTPADWLFVHWAADRSAFVAPDAIDALVNDFHIPIHGEGEPPRLRPMTGS